MAKNVKGGSVEIKVTDKGSLKQLGKNAKQAGKDVGSVAKNVQESDRRLKSLSNQTSNSSKAFAKQAQTIEGGLVPIYATLAAQVFAVSAAYRFLTESGNFKNLMEGQLAYGAATGVMYKSLAGSIREATFAQISYSEASQAAAIGIASGLNASQLTELGTAAANASLILGRDVTDSFNRLVRGVTKAEPELLDELGIILRLDPALRKYADALGVSKETLTPFQRTQAVTNEVLEQAEKKFGGIMKIMDPTAFAVNQFGQAFNDVLDDIKVLVGNLAQTVLPLFTNNITALIAAFGLFAGSVLRSFLPNFGAIEASAIEASGKIKGRIAELNRDMSVLKAAAALQGMPEDQIKGKATSLQSKFAARYGSQFQDKNLASLTAYRSAAQKGKGFVGTLPDNIKAKYKADLDELVIYKKAAEGKMSIDTETRFAKEELARQQNELKEQQSLQRRTQNSQRFSSAMLGIFKYVSYIGFGLIALDLLKSAYRYFDPLSEAMQDAIDNTEKFKKGVDDATDSLKQMNQIRDEGLISSTEYFTQFANSISSQDLLGQIGRGNTILGDIEDYKKTLTLLDAANGEYMDLIEKGEKIPKTLGNLIQRTIGDAKFGVGEYEGFVLSAEEINLAIDSMNSLIDFSKNLKEQAKFAHPEYRDSLLEIAAAYDRHEKPTKQQIQNLMRLGEEYVNLNGKLKAYTETEKQYQQQLTGFLATYAKKDPVSTALNTNKLFLEQNEKALQTLKKTLETELGKVVDDDYFTQAMETGRVENIFGMPDVALLQLTKDELQDLRDEYAKLNTTRQTALGVQEIIEKSLDKSFDTEIARIDAERAGLEKNASLRTAVAEKVLDYQKREQQILKLKNQQTIFDDILIAANEEKLKLSDEQKTFLEESLKMLGFQIDKEENINQILKDRARIRREGQDEQLVRGRGELGTRFGLGGLGFTKQGAAIAKAANDPDLIASQMMNMFGEKKVYTDQEREAAKQALIDQETIFQQAKMNLDFIAAGMDRIGTAMSDGVANAIVSVVDGTKTMKEAFSELAKSVIADLTKMAIRMFIMNALFPGSGTAMAALPTPGPMGRSGGVMSSPGYRSYMSGGIATGPDSGYQATLHGTEAVVPLGNSRSIPVELKGAGGGVNNVTVNISTDGTVSTDSDAEETKAFGKQISNVVIREIEIQKRPGGLLAR